LRSATRLYRFRKLGFQGGLLRELLFLGDGSAVHAPASAQQMSPSGRWSEAFGRPRDAPYPQPAPAITAYGCWLAVNS